MLVALLVCLIPTTIGALLSAIGIAGMDRLVQRNVLAMSGRAVEAAGDVNTLLLDKTGTITLGNRQAAEFLPVPGRRRSSSSPTRRSSRASPTRRPEGRSIVVLAKERYGLRGRDLEGAEFVPVHRADADERRRPSTGAQLRKGAARLGPALGRGAGRRRVPDGGRRRSSTASRSQGGTPLVVAEDAARPRRRST